MAGLPPPRSALRLPASRRISAPNSLRLNAITESPPSTSSSNPPPVPTRNPLREMFSSWRDASPPPSYASRRVKTTRDQLAEINIDEDSENAPVEGEKLAALRRQGSKSTRRRRGGFVRFALLVLVFLAIIAIALGVGLGVGLKDHKSRQNSNTGDNQTQPDVSEAPFPVGEWRISTNLRMASTDCTANAATWRCFPYVTYDPSDSSTNESSQVAFDWIIMNSSAVFATNMSSSQSSSGIPANLSISSTDNPFSISFTNNSLTYSVDSSNASSARLTFSFEMSKTVIPTTSLTSDNSASECYFNSTMFSGTLYLAGSRITSDPSIWPYAVEVTQTAFGGSDTPACYDTSDGALGARITDGLDPQPENEACVCEYNNYGE